MKPSSAYGKFLRRIGIGGALVLAFGMLLGSLSSCTMGSTSSTYYPQAKDEEAYRARYKPLKDELADDEGAISQSHTDARRGLNPPGDQPGVSNDGVGLSSYR